MLSDKQLLRYNRQLLLPEFDIAGQERLLASRVLIVGLGGLGCPAALYLGAAGVGKLLLADGDHVELGNLQRQVAHGERDIGANKARSAVEAVSALNQEIKAEAIEARLTAAAMNSLVSRVDLVLDATDNYPARFALNRACIAAGVPLLSAAAVRTEGQLALFDPARGGPCYRCLYNESAEKTALSCSESGVLAPVVGVIGSLLAMEAVKVLTGFGVTLRGKLLVMDLRTMDIRQLALAPRHDCPDCAHLDPQK